MNKTPFTHAWLVMSLVGTCLGQPDEGPSEVSRLAKARSDKDSIRVIDQVIHTTDVAGPFLGPQIHMEVSEVTDGIVRIRIQIPRGEVTSSCARQALDHIIANLPKALGQVYEEKKARIDLDLRQAWDQKMKALATLQPGVPLDRPTQATLEQLEKTVDLSRLRPDVPLADAVDLIRKSVTPPVNIVVLWNELEAQGIDQTSPLKMDGIKGIKLETGLKLFVRAVSDPSVELDYVIQDSVITIGTKETVESLRPQVTRLPGQGLNERELRNKKASLLNEQAVRATELAEMRAKVPAMEEQVAAMKKQIEAQVENDPLTKEIQQLAALLNEQTQQIRRQIEAGRATEADYAQAAERLVKAKIDLAKQRETAFAAAGGQRIAELRQVLSDMPVRIAERDATLRATRDQLAKIDIQLDQAAAMASKEIERDMAVRSLQEAEQRIFELEKRAAEVQPPWITFFGKDQAH